MGIISWIILGLIAGFIGSKIVDREGQGFWLDIALGIVGGFLFDLFGASDVTGLEYLQHDRRNCGTVRCAADLQHADRSSPIRLRISNFGRAPLRTALRLVSVSH